MFYGRLQFRKKSRNCCAGAGTYRGTGACIEPELLFGAKPGAGKETDSEDTTVYWDVSTNDSNEIVVLFRSYTGSETRYYIDPVSGETYSTELVPGIIDEEQRTDESFNVKDYMK